MQMRRLDVMDIAVDDWDFLVTVDVVSRNRSDQGCTCASEGCRDVLDAHSIICNKSRRGNWFHNAVMERLFSAVMDELADQFARNGDARMRGVRYIGALHSLRLRHTTVGHVNPQPLNDEL